MTQQKRQPGLIGYAVHRLLHARAVKVLDEPLGPGVRLVLLERAERAVAVRERGLEALERPRFGEDAARGARRLAVIVHLPKGVVLAGGTNALVPICLLHLK